MSQPSQQTQLYCFTSGAYHVVKQRGTSQVLTTCDSLIELGGNFEVHVTDTPPADRRFCYHCNGKIRRSRALLEKRRRTVAERLQKAEHEARIAVEYEALLRDQLILLDKELESLPHITPEG
jgi:hypothetical protein